MTTALIVIDIQNDYFPGGKMELEGSLEASLCAQQALAACRGKGLPLVHVQHISVRPGATFFLPGTDGVRIHENVTPLAGETVIQKNSPNSFRNTNLLDHLKQNQVDRLVILGMMTQMCVDATTRAAFDAGFACTVLHDACAARAVSFEGLAIPAQQVHGAFLAALGSVYAKVMSTREYLAQM